jgi:hypothetical protein
MVYMCMLITIVSHLYLYSTFHYLVDASWIKNCDWVLHILNLVLKMLHIPYGEIERKMHE